jgi:hypothetical protein
MTDVVPPPPPVTDPIPVAEPAAPGPPRRRTPLIVGAVIVAVALIAGISYLSFGGDDEAQAGTLAFAFAEGDTQTYAIHQTMDATIGGELVGGEVPLSMEMTQSVTWDVTDVADDGTATIVVSVDSANGTVNGAPIPPQATATQPIEFEIAPDGRIVSAGGLALGGAGQTQGFGFPGMSQMTPILPPGGDAEVGDTWDKSFSQEFPFGEGTLEFEAHSRYDRDETIDGREAAVIVTDLEVPLDITLEFSELLAALGDDLIPSGATGVTALQGATIDYGGSGSFTSTAWVDLETHELLRSTSEGDFDMTMVFTGIPDAQGEVAFDGTFTQELAVR